MLSAWNQQEKVNHGRFFDAKGVLFGGSNVKTTTLKVKKMARAGNKATDMMQKKCHCPPAIKQQRSPMNPGFFKML